MTVLRTAKILVIDKEDNILVLRRSSTHPWAAFQPDLPGGLVEDSETIEQGALRELREETGIVLDEASIINPHEKVRQHFGLINIGRDLFIIHLDELKPDITISWEHDRFDWIPVHELKGLERPVQAAYEDIIKRELWKKPTSA
jgi:8-oxo-dGTP diphosphatase